MGSIAHRRKKEKAAPNGAGASTAGSVTIHNYALTPEDLTRVMEQAQQGQAAYGWIGQAHG